MSKGQVYEVVSSDGVVREYPIGKRPLLARDAKLVRGSHETHSGHTVINPLNRQPAIKEQFAALERSGALARMQRQADNLAKVLDGDPTFEGYDREELEALFISDAERDFVLDRVQRIQARTEASDDSDTPLADDSSEAPPPPLEGEA